MKSTSPAKTVLKTSLPAAIDLSSQTIMWMIEAIMLGRISVSAMAGVGMAIQTMLVFFAMMLTFVVGASLIINRHLGASDHHQANHIFGQALMMGIIMAISFAMIWFFGAVHIFKLIEEGDAILAEKAGVTYIRTIALFAPFLITNFVAIGIVRGTGDTRFSMMVNVLINGINAILAPILIFGLFFFPRLEVFGAALAAGIAHTIGFFVTFWLLRSRKLQLFLSFRELTRPRWASFKELFKTGMPTTIEQLTWALGQLVVTGYAAGIGLIVLSTHTVFMRIQSLLSMIYMGFALAAMTLMGKNLGAADNVLALRTARTAQRIMTIFVALIVAALFLFAEQIMQVFTSEAATIALGQKAIYVFAIAQIPKAFNNVLCGNMRGAGDLEWLMWTTIVFVAIFEIGLNYVSAFMIGFGLYGIWAVQAIDESIRIGLNLWRFHGAKWKV